MYSRMPLLPDTITSLSMDGRSHGGCCSDGDEVSSLLLLAFGTAWTGTWAVCSVWEGTGMWPGTGPGDGSSLWPHGLTQHVAGPLLYHLLWFGVGRLALGDEGGYSGEQSMDTIIRELVVIREDLIPEVPEMFLRLDGCLNSIRSKLGHHLSLWGDGAIVYEGLHPWTSILSCFQPAWQSSASSVLMSKASR